MATLPSTSRGFQDRRLRSMTSFNILNRSNSSLVSVKNSCWTRKYVCTDCGRSYTLKASLTRHKQFECNAQTLKGSSELGDRKPKEHVCGKCKRSYTFLTSLWRHQRYECGVEPRFICPVCRTKFAQKSNLDRHVRTRH